MFCVSLSLFSATVGAQQVQQTASAVYNFGVDVIMSALDRSMPPSNVPGAVAGQSRWAQDPKLLDLLVRFISRPSITHVD